MRRACRFFFAGWLLAAALGLPGCSCRETPPAPVAAGPQPPAPPAAEAPRAAANGKGRLYFVNSCRVLELAGTPEEMGQAHGQLLGADVRRVIKEVLRPATEPERYQRITAGARVMEKFQPEPYRRELRSLAEASGADYLDLMALQLFGDAERGRSPGADAGREKLGQQCTSFAAFGPATAGGELIAGRNFDYWYEQVNAHAALAIHYRPAGGRSFLTLSWAGVINGWTLMNDAGLVAANNNAYGSSESLEGVSTCFLQRLAVERCATVDEAVDLVRRSPRAVGTVMLLAGGQPPAAAVVEFDHAAVAVRRAENGWVAAANGFRALGREKPLAAAEDASGRYGALVELLGKHHGRIDRSMNFAAAPGVPIESINLHSALLFPADRTICVSMGQVPACKQPYRKLRLTDKGVESAE